MGGGWEKALKEAKGLFPWKANEREEGRWPRLKSKILSQMAVGKPG